MTTPERAEINRRNAQKSTGPKTLEGKNRCRFNAVKHGLTARIPVLPGEDSQAYEARLEAWTDDLQPRNDLERFLIDRVVRASWQLERADRADTARLAGLIRNAPVEEAHRRQEEVAAVGRRLFHDAQGPLPLYPQPAYQAGQPRVSSSRRADDPDHPAALVLRLEATGDGCRWLLDRWAELLELLDRGRTWQPPEKLRVIRLLGKQPLDAADDPEVAMVFLACDAMGTQEQAIFTDLRGELLPAEMVAFEARLRDRQVEARLPEDEATARATLRALIGRATARLEAIAQAHAQREAANAAEAADRLSFDAGVEAERLRRHQTTCTRSLLRTLGTLEELRRGDAAPQPSSPEPGPADPSESVLGTDHRIFFGSEETGHRHSAGSDPAVQPPTGLVGFPHDPHESRPLTSLTPHQGPGAPTPRSEVPRGVGRTDPAGAPKVEGRTAATSLMIFSSPCDECQIRATCPGPSDGQADSAWGARTSLCGDGPLPMAPVGLMGGNSPAASRPSA